MYRDEGIRATTQECANYSIIFLSYKVAQKSYPLTRFILMQKRGGVFCHPDFKLEAMSLYETLLSDLKTAMKTKDERRRQVLRALKSGVLEKEIAGRQGGERGQVSDELVIEVLTKAAKQRRDSLSQYEQAGRDDLATVEREELEIIEGYLPAQLSKAEITALVDEAISETGAGSMKEMGKVMGALMPKVKGKADGKLVSATVKEQLSKL